MFVQIPIRRHFTLGILPFCRIHHVLLSTWFPTLKNQAKTPAASCHLHLAAYPHLARMDVKKKKVKKRKGKKGKRTKKTEVETDQMKEAQKQEEV